ncbi:MAG: type 4a pilus biogenesis protein PilO [Acidobacteriota bacterium]|jgi:type IV pilus assembly protein PilO
MAFGNIKLENVPRRVQNALIAALGLSLAFLGYWFYLKDLQATRSVLQSEVAQLQSSVSQAVAVEQRLSQFKRELAELDVRLDELRRILPSQKETPDVLRAVQRMADESNLKIVKFVPQPVATRAFYLDWPIAMEIQGSYNALGTFFEKIGMFTRVVNVDNINVKNIEGSTDPTKTLNSNCTATTFVYREEQAAAPDKQGAHENQAAAPGKSGKHEVQAAAPGKQSRHE